MVLILTGTIPAKRTDPCCRTLSIPKMVHSPENTNAGKNSSAGYATVLSVMIFPVTALSMTILMPCTFPIMGVLPGKKGLDVLAKSAQLVLDHVPEARFVVLGQGDPVLESNLVRMSMRYNGRFVFLGGYERSLARMAVATSDFLVLPSMFEPCGLEDYIGQIYGTIPVAHAVGGLKKIENGPERFFICIEKLR